jgi:hypothetical protein
VTVDGTDRTAGRSGPLRASLGGPSICPTDLQDEAVTSRQNGSGVVTHLRRVPHDLAGGPRNIDRECLLYHSRKSRAPFFERHEVDRTASAACGSARNRHEVRCLAQPEAGDGDYCPIQLPGLGLNSCSSPRWDWAS